MTCLVVAITSQSAEQGSEELGKLVAARTEETGRVTYLTQLDRQNLGSSKLILYIGSSTSCREVVSVVMPRLRRVPILSFATGRVGSKETT